MKSERSSRQSFLGADSDERFARTVVGIVGLGGGGSHIAQQLAHVGFKRYVLFDGDTPEHSNLNRLIGATVADVEAGTPKLDIARRLILGLQPDAKIEGYPTRWQEHPEALRRCHIIFGGVDDLSGRAELEQLSRQYLAAYIDVGMDVFGKKKPPVICGQIILSLPGEICMHCMGFITEEGLNEEGRRYGDAGGHPQVVWPNGVLASTAVGLAVELITNWTGTRRRFAYLRYDGNKMVLKPDLRTAEFEQMTCTHYPSDRVGDPIFIKR
jgi:molybdopterin-synthase adenylyltransferase